MDDINKKIPLGYRKDAKTKEHFLTLIELCSHYHTQIEANTTEHTMNDVIAIFAS